MGKEIWKPVVGFENTYMVSSYGNVKGIVRSGSTGCMLKPIENRCGYQTVSLYEHPISKRCMVHRLVALAFIPNPDGKRTVNHKDGNKKNNCVDNLEWATHSENHKHAYRIGLRTVSEKQKLAASATGKRTCEMNRPKTPVVRIDSYGNEAFFDSCHAGARSVSGGASPIVRCCRGKKKTYKGYEWRYVVGEDEQREG